MQLCSSLNIFGGGLVAKSCPALVTSWTVVCQAPLSMGFSREEYWSGLPFSSPGDLHNPGIKPGSPALQADSLRTELHLSLGHSLALPFFGIGTKTELFQACGHCGVFQICCHIECSTLTPSSFRIWNSSAGIPSPPLALFIVLLPKAHLTSHSRTSGSTLVTTPLWLSGSLRLFWYTSSVYSCCLVLIYSTSIGSLLFLSFIMPSLHEMFPWYFQFS